MRDLGWIFVTTLFVACGSSPDELGTGDDDDDVVGDDDDDQTGAGVEVSWTLEANSTNMFGAIAEIQAAEPTDASVWIEYGTDASFDRSTPLYSLADAQELTVQVLGLHADSTYDMRLAVDDQTRVARSEPQSLTTGVLPAYFPPCEVITDADLDTFDDQEIFCTNAGPPIGGTPFVFCVDRRGTPVWMLRHPDDEIMNNVLPLSDGRFAGTGRSAEFTALFDRFGDLSQQYTSTGFEDEGSARYSHHWINEHELVELREGPWAGKHAVLTITSDDIDGVVHMAPGILVFDPDTGEILWDWMAHGELGDNVPIDPKIVYHHQGLLEEGEMWMFANALAHEVVDGEQYFWLNSRNQNWIFKIDVQDDSVVWRFGYEGEFALVDDLDAADPAELANARWPFHQHDPEILQRDGSRVRFMLFDNGNVRPGPDGEAVTDDPYSRVVEYELDEQTMRATIHFEYGGEVGEPVHFFSGIYGNALLLPDGESLVYTNGDGSDGPYLAEVSYPQGVEQWRFFCAGVYFYRALYFEDIYAMTW